MRTFSVLVLLTAHVSLMAAPPSLEIPAEVRPAGQYVEMHPKTDAAYVTYVGLDGIDAVPSILLKDGKVFLLDTRGLKDGRYKFAAVGSSKTGEPRRVDFAVVIGKGETEPPPKLDPTPDPRPDPIPNPSPKSYYFLIVRADGPPPLSFTKTMELPEWKTLRAAGHKVKDMTQTEAKPWFDVPPALLPAVVTLETVNGKSVIVRTPIPLPGAGPGILDLPKGVE